MANWDKGSDARRAYQKQWRAKNKDYASKWKKANPAFIDGDGDHRELGPYYVQHTLTRIKSVAKRKNLAFDLEVEDIIVPTHCPVLGIELKPGMGKGGMKDSSPSLDKIIPSLGYTKGNVIVVSNKANRIKSDATVDEIQAVADFYRELLFSKAD